MTSDLQTSTTLLPEQISPIQCLFQPSIGGMGLDGTERLIRFVSRIEQLTALLGGALSLTKALKFTTEDPHEGEETKEDKRWRERFWGSLAGNNLALFIERRNAILDRSYVSCWHRIGLDSEITRLGRQYLGEEEFQFAIVTSVERVLSSIPPPDGTPMWLDFFGVRYIGHEDARLEDYLEGQFPFCGYPLLEFKRKRDPVRNHDFEYEREARFVMHDHSVSSVGFQHQIDNPICRYAAVTPSIFIDRIFSLNLASETKLHELVPIHLANINMSFTSLYELERLCRQGRL